MKLSDIIDPLLLLLNDALASEQRLGESDGQVERRSYVRSTMAAIEGTIWILKQTCLNAKDPKGLRRFSVAEFAMLSDQTYDLKNNGEVRTTTKFLKLPDNLRFTINLCNRLFGCKLDLCVGQPPWDRFLKAVEVRNRITHPKVVASFEVSDQEIEDCKEVISWFNSIVHSFIIQITKNAESLDDRDKA